MGSSQLGRAQLGRAQLGSPGESNTIRPQSLTSTSAFGAVLVSDGTIKPGTLTSTSSIPSPSVAGTIKPSSITSSSAFGAVSLLPAIFPPSLTSTSAFGAVKLGANILAPSLTSTSAFGTLRLKGNILVPSLTSVSVFPTPKLRGKILFGDGIRSVSGFGRPTVTSSITGSRLYIQGRDRTSIYMPETMRISVPMSGPASAQFRIYDTGLNAPAKGAEVVYFFNGIRKFGGFIQDVNVIGLDGRLEAFIECRCIDYYAILKGRRIAYDYNAFTSLRAILDHVVTEGLYGDGVGLAPMLDEEIEPNQNLIFGDDPVSQVLERLAEITGRDIWIDMHRMIHAEHRVLISSGFVVHPYAANWRDAKTRGTDRNSRSVQGVTLPAGSVVTRREEPAATGNWQAARTLYAIGDEIRPRVWRNTVAQSVIFPDEMGTVPGLVMVEHGSNWINLVPGAAGQTAPSISDDWVIEYVPMVESSVLWTEDANLVAARAARSRTSGRIEAVTDTGGLITEAGAATTAQSYLDRYRDQMEVSFISDAPSANQIDIGKSIEIDSDRPFAKGKFVVTEYSMQDQVSFMRYGVKAVGLEALRVLSASNASPIVVETEVPHRLDDGQTVSIYGVQGNTAVNVENWPVRVVDTTTFRLSGRAGNSAYTEGGYVVVDAVQHKRGIASVTGAGVSPIIVETTHPHDYAAVANVDAYEGTNWQAFPIASVDSVTGNVAANGTGHSLVPLDASTVAIGPVAPGPGQDIATWTSNGSTLTVTTIEPHSLTTGNPVIIIGSGSDADGVARSATVTGASTFTVPSSSAGSGSGGTAAMPRGAFFASAVGSSLVVVTKTAHGLTTGQYVTIYSAAGFPAIAGNWAITVVDANTFTLDGSSLVGTTSAALVMPWPIGSGAGAGGELIAGYGHSEFPVSSTSGDQIALTKPHGIVSDPVNLPDYPRLSIAGPTAEIAPLQVVSVVDATTLQVSADVSTYTQEDLTLGLEDVNGDNRLGFGALDGPRQLSNVFRRLAGYKIRSVERATFILASAIPGYSASALQTGTNLTNEYTVVHDGVFRQIVVYFKSPPLGGSIQLDIKKNGTTILSGPIVYPEAQSLPLRYNNFASLNMRVAKSDRLTVDVISVGSQFPGCDGSIHVLMGTL